MFRRLIWDLPPFRSYTRGLYKAKCIRPGPPGNQAFPACLGKALIGRFKKYYTYLRIYLTSLRGIINMFTKEFFIY